MAFCGVAGAVDLEASQFHRHQYQHHQQHHQQPQQYVPQHSSWSSNWHVDAAAATTTGSGGWWRALYQDPTTLRGQQQQQQQHQYYHQHVPSSATWDLERNRKDAFTSGSNQQQQQQQQQQQWAHSTDSVAAYHRSEHGGEYPHHHHHHHQQQRQQQYQQQSFLEEADSIALRVVSAVLDEDEDDDIEDDFLMNLPEAFVRSHNVGVDNTGVDGRQQLQQQQQLQQHQQQQQQHQLQHRNGSTLVGWGMDTSMGMDVPGLHALGVLQHAVTWAKSSPPSSLPTMLAGTARSGVDEPIRARVAATAGPAENATMSSSLASYQQPQPQSQQSQVPSLTSTTNVPSTSSSPSTAASADGGDDAEAGDQDAVEQDEESWETIVAHAVTTTDAGKAVVDIAAALKQSYRIAVATSLQAAGSIASANIRIQGHVCMQLGAKARSESRLLPARLWYRSATKVAAAWTRPWLELSKFEEEIGNIHLAAAALLRGLSVNAGRLTEAQASAMAVRAVRLQGRLHQSAAANSTKAKIAIPTGAAAVYSSSASPNSSPSLAPTVLLSSAHDNSASSNPTARQVLAVVLKPYMHATQRHVQLGVGSNGVRGTTNTTVTVTPPTSESASTLVVGHVPSIAASPMGSPSSSSSGWSSDEDMGWAHALVAEKRQPPFSHYHYNHNIYQQHYQHQHHHHQNPAAQSSVYYPTVYPGSNEMTSSSLQGQANSGTHIRGYQQPQNVKAAAADPASNTTVSPSSSATSGGNWPWRLILEGALLEWRLGRRQLALATLDHVQRVLPHRAQPYLHSVDLLKKESRYIEAYRIAVSALRLLPSAGMLWFEALALQLHLLLTWKRSCDKQSPVSDAEMQTVSTLPWRVLADPSATTTDANTTNVTADFEGRSVDCSGASCPWSIEQILDNKAHRLLHFSSVWLPQLQADALDHLSPELTHRFLIEVARAHVLAGEHASQSQPSSQDKPAESRSSSTSNTFLTRARRALASAVRAAPPNLQFKVWLEGARLELRYGDSKVARKSLLQAVKLAPLKSRSAVLTEWARLEQYLPSPNRFDEARRILNKAKRSMPSDWKVHLESILLEMRAGAFAFALALTHEALRLFPSSGRLWALRVQLEYLCYHQQQRSSGGALPSSKLSVPRSAMRALEEATRQCPKSGEVWCEAARLAIANREFSLARRYLEYSTHFTPQLGDSLVEWLRLEMLEQNVIAGTTASDRSIKDQMTALYGTVGRADLSPPNYGMVWTFCKNLPLDSTLHTLLVSTQRQLVALSVGGNNAASSSPSPQEATTTTATVVPLPSTTYAASLDIASWVATLNFASVDSVLRFKLLFD